VTTHADHRFSVTLQTDDLAIVNCLRALAKFSQKTGNNLIPWGGTKDSDWKTAQRQVTFYFSSIAYRDGFLSEVARVLPPHLLKVLGTQDDKAATPQGR